VAEEPVARPVRRGLVGPFSGRQIGLAVGLVVLAALAIVAVTRPLGSLGGGPALPVPGATQVLFASPTQGLAVGAQAPDFAVPLPDGTTFGLTDLDGAPIRLADLRGRGVWITFWASWCPPCQQETPVIRELAEEYRERGLEVVAVQVQETVDDGRRYAERYGLRYTIGSDVSGHVFRAYRVFGLPTQFFLDGDGVIRAVVPAPMTLEQARGYVESVLPADTSLSPSPSPSATP
jgi:peroxiredoxin